MSTWPAIVYDPNTVAITDVVTKEYAEEIPVGTQIMAVVLDGTEFPTTWEQAILAVVTEHHPTVDGKAVIIYAEAVE